MIKKIFTIILFTSVISSAGWQKLNSNTTEWLTDVCFVNEWTGFAVGYNGTILKTTNGGINWTITHIANGEALTYVYFINENKGFVVGLNSLIASTEDGGNTWSYKYLSTNTNFSEINFTDELHGWLSAGISDSNGEIFKTTDGGQTWISVYTFSSTNFSGIKFRTNSYGYAVGRNGWFYKTTDAGSHWSANSISNNVLQDIEIVGNDLWVTGDHGKIMKSTDDGATWITIPPKSDDHLFKATFVDSTFGWIAGGYGTGFESYSSIILNTEDGGGNWSSIQNSSWPKLYAIAAPSKDLAYAVGYNGTILRYDRYSPFLKLQSPIGGEAWGAISSHNIQWTSAAVLSVNIYYSTDNGSSWKTIVENVSGTYGSYYWQLPNLTSPSCLIKIVDANNPAVYDISDNVFSIIQLIHVVSPNGGETWLSDSIQEIKWTADKAESVLIEYSTDSGSTWNSIINNISAAIGSYYWKVPKLISSNCKVRVSDYDYHPINDVSDETFTITNQPELSLLTPIGGEVWKAGSRQYINWNSKYVDKINIEFSKDGGLSWALIAGSIDASTKNYLWNVPYEISDNCKIRVSDYHNGSINDQSENKFSIYSALEVLYPNGKEILKSGSIQKISWKSTNTQSIKIQYSVNNGVSWSNVVLSISANTGYYNWVVPNISSESCQIKISDVDIPEIYDVSDNTFSIINLSLTLKKPLGFDYVKADTLYSILWTSENVEKIKIEFTTNSGSTWGVVANNVDASTGKYDWLVPRVTSSECKIRITDVSDSTVSDQSDNNFFIFNPAVTVIYPNGGENWKEGDFQNITWVYEYISDVKIELSTDNGSTWSTVVSSVSGFSKNFIVEVPNINSSHCKIRISDVLNSSTFDESDSTFTISPLVGINKENDLPDEYKLEQNFPNPFNPSTRIEYQIVESGNVSLKVFDLLGREVAELVNEMKSPGRYSTVFNASELSGGIYFYVLRVNNYNETHKMILLK